MTIDKHDDASGAPVDLGVSQHTPGPWEIIDRDDDLSMAMNCIAQAGAMGETVNSCRLNDDPNAIKVIAITFHQIEPLAGMECDDDDNLSCVNRARANARLIAAAPELLAALQQLRYACTDKAEAMADAAIAKATGRDC